MGWGSSFALSPKSPKQTIQVSGMFVKISVSEKSQKIKPNSWSWGNWSFVVLLRCKEEEGLMMLEVKWFCTPEARNA